VKAIVESIVSLYGILPGDWNASSLEVGSAPLQVNAAPAQIVPAVARGRLTEHKALPAKAGTQMAAPAAPLATAPGATEAGARRIVVE
jgi:hypothetical protein